MRFFAIGLVLCGCGDNLAATDAPHGQDTPLVGVDSPALDARPIDAAPVPDAGPRGPAAFPMPGGGDGLYWDNAAHVLYLTDDTHDQLATWTDADGFGVKGTFPSASAGIALGMILQQNGGTFLTPSFGFGTQGTIFRLKPDGTSDSITGLDPVRRRIGLVRAPNDGALYDGYFTGTSASATGGVASLTLTAGVGVEVPIVTTGLQKVVGLAVTADAIYISDQTANKIFTVPRAGGTPTLVAALPSVDLLTLLPDGDLATGGVTGGVYRIHPATGAVSTIASGFEQVRGTAYDPTLHRLFIMEHRVAITGDQLHVIPFDP